MDELRSTRPPDAATVCIGTRLSDGVGSMRKPGLRFARENQQWATAPS
jgi:hypothetical protein